MANKLIKRRYNNLLTARNNYFAFGGNNDGSSPSLLNFTSTAYHGYRGNADATQRFINSANSHGANISTKDLPGSLGGTSMASDLNSQEPSNSIFKNKDFLNALGTATGQVGGGLIGGGLESGAGSLISGLSGIASAIPGPWGAVASAGLGLIGGLTNRMFGSKMNTENIAKVEANINSLNNFQSDASDFDTLSQNWANAVTGMTFSNDFIGKDGWFSHKARNKAASLRNQIEAGNTWVQNTLNNNAENITSTQMQNLLANYAAYGGPLFAEGGRIHIKPENRGKFTETKRRTGKTTEELTHSKNPLTRKRAIFAQNAKKWHHAFGGDLMTHGANFDTGVTLVGNGGTHEENPLEGVPMGVDQEGVSNLVEEGEVIFNDYVFSNRLKVPKEVKKKYKIRGNKSLTFADAALQMAKESEERPNDPISQAGLDDSMTKLMMSQEQIRERKGKTNKFAGGGSTKNPYDLYESPAWTQDPVRTVPTVDFNQAWTTNYQDKVRRGMMPVIGREGADKLFTGPLEVSTDFLKRTNKYENDLRALELSGASRNNTNNTVDKPSLPLEQTWMRYIPAFASGAMSLTDALGWTNKPDYGEANAVLEAAKGAGVYSPVSFNPIGNYMTYRPFDRDYYTNKLNAEAGATRRALLNTSGGNRAQAMAGILAADNNAQNKMGDLFRQAEEYNLAQRQKVEDFNRATNIANAEGILKADMANQSALMQSKSSYLKGALAANELRQKERQMSTASKSANLSNFINSLGDIGRENFSRNMITSDPSKYYYIDSRGVVHYKAAYDKLSNEDKAEVDNELYSKTRSKAKGGYLTIKRRKRK